MSAPSRLGRVTGDLADALAFVNSPGAIKGEIDRLEAAILGGDRSEETRVLLSDWQAVRRAQRRLVAGDSGDGEAPLQRSLVWEEADR